MVVGSLIPLAPFSADFYFKGLEIQLYDTYFVMNPFEFALVPIGLLLFCVFLVRNMVTGFRARLAWVFLGIGTVIVGAVVLEVFEIMNRM